MCGSNLNVDMRLCVYRESHCDIDPDHELLILTEVLIG